MKSFFGDISRGAVRNSGKFGNLGSAGEILEFAWSLQRKKQKGGGLVDCTGMIQRLGRCVLLV